MSPPKKRPPGELGRIAKHLDSTPPGEPPPEYVSKIIILQNRLRPSLFWRSWRLTAEQARRWANELQTAANLAEQAWGLEEAARESKEGK